mmetsp:Transcript_51796/g.150411  ORF Transcript_51796/g.150411 Transcript_51796/m.150411 type:complete len:202 (+) Transcript_51796:1601-2206(+)
MSCAAAVRKASSSSKPRQPYSHLQVPVYCGGAKKMAPSRLFPATASSTAVRVALGTATVLPTGALATAVSTTASSSPTVEQWKTSCGRNARSGAASRSVLQRLSTARESMPARLLSQQSSVEPRAGANSSRSRAPTAVAGLAAGAALIAAAPVASAGDCGVVHVSSVPVLARSALGGRSMMSLDWNSHQRLSKSLRHDLQK